MANKKPGRKKLPKGQAKKMVPAYLNDEQKRKINKAHGNITNALIDIVLPQCETDTI